MSLTGMASASFKYADVAHARLISVDTSFAETMPGVVAVLTADDVPYPAENAALARQIYRHGLSGC